MGFGHGHGKKKNGQLRLCLAWRSLNKAKKRPTYPIPVVDKLLERLSRAKAYSVLDTKNGFWKVQMDEESSNLPKLATSFGRYKWKIMSFRILTAPEIFQEKLDRSIE